MSSSGWSDEAAEIAAAALSLSSAAADLGRLVDELAAILEATLPGACVVDRSFRGGPVRGLSVDAGRWRLGCLRRGDGTWDTTAAPLQGGTIGPPRAVSAEAWVQMLRAGLQARCEEQADLTDRIRGLLG